MTSEWETKALDKFILLQRGHDLPADQRVKGDIPVAGSQGITGFHNESIGIVPGLTIGRSGSIGATQFFKNKYYPLNTTLYATDFLGNDPLYSYYYFKNFDFSPYNSGSVQPSLNRNFLYTADVDIPPLHEQKAIAHILGTLDEKIELNLKTNKTLEGIAKALFKSWFVDFDPVRAKAEGRPTGLPDEISELFPDSFEESELGEIPSGWKVDEIGNVVECVGGSTPSTKESEYWDEGVNYWATPKDLSDLSEPFLLDTAKKITDLGVTKISSGILPMGTVLLSSRAPVGYVAVAKVPVSVNQGFIAMKPSALLPTNFLLNWTLANVQQFKDRASGTTFAEISKKAFRPVPVLLPRSGVVNAFTEIVEPLYENVVLNMKQSGSLTALRDALLPRLISGELRVPDAEKILEEVGI